MGLSAGGVVPLGWDRSVSSAGMGERVHTKPVYCSTLSFVEATVHYHKNYDDI